MKVFYYLIFTIYFLTCTVAHAQYAPQAGLPGSTAIAGSSRLFVGWATGCSVQRGYMDIATPSLGRASSGDSVAALGAADGLTVSLGDSGIAVVTFASPVINGAGPDLAVFENGFLEAGNDSEAFLELAFVEVSSDGINYTRFPAASVTPDNVQAGNDSYLYANNLHNLAGSYIARYGTPFDLEELAGTPGLDINNIIRVRIVDVIGSISGHSSYDSAGRIVNDPYPTPYPSCGFDLDAVGVIHQAGTSTVAELQNSVSVSLYPNPVSNNLYVVIRGVLPTGLKAKLTTISGTIIEELNITENTTMLSVESYPTGMYYLELRDLNGTKCVEKFIKY